MVVVLTEVFVFVVVGVAVVVVVVVISIDKYSLHFTMVITIL